MPTCFSLRRRRAAVALSRARLLRDLLGAAVMLRCGCGRGGVNGVMREVLVLALIRGWTPTPTLMRMRTTMVIVGRGPGRPMRIE